MSASDRLESSIPMIIWSYLHIPCFLLMIYSGTHDSELSMTRLLLRLVECDLQPRGGLRRSTSSNPFLHSTSYSFVACGPSSSRFCSFFGDWVKGQQDTRSGGGAFWSSPLLAGLSPSLPFSLIVPLNHWSTFLVGKFSPCSSSPAYSW